MKENKTIRLDDRLSAAASFVRPGAVVADIGTDHAYLPVYLLERGIATRAIASDVNRGPLERARQTAEKAGTRILAKMTFTLADGVPTEGMDDVTDIVICGMGGELIARIVEASAHTRRPGVRLILQPMTAADDLRAYLDAGGFAVEDEILAEAAGRVYCCLSVVYDGVRRTSSPAEKLLGKCAIAKREPLFDRYAREHRARLDTKIAGMQKGGRDTAAEMELRAELTAILGEKQ